VQEPELSRRFGPFRRPDLSRERVRDDRPRAAVPEVAAISSMCSTPRAVNAPGERRSGLTVLTAIPGHGAGADEDRAAGLYSTPASLRAASNWSTVIVTEP
jgi:hypothetical protein